MSISREYLSYPLIKDLISSKQNSEHTIKIAVYNNGLWKVIPNPFDEMRCASVQQNYRAGYFISVETGYISQDTYNNDKYWR